MRNGVHGSNKRPQICSAEEKWRWQFTQMCCSLNFPPISPHRAAPGGGRVRDMKGKRRELQTVLEFHPHHAKKGEKAT